MTNLNSLQPTVIEINIKKGKIKMADKGEIEMNFHRARKFIVSAHVAIHPV